MMENPLVIDDKDTVAMASELAALTGESLAGAVTVALRKQLEKERHHQRRIADIMAIAADIRSHMRQPLPTSDMTDWYDENGLPT